MRKAICLVTLLVSSGCASTSVYDIVGEEIINPAATAVRYAANWYRTRPLDVIGPANEREVFYKDVATCAATLEASRREFLKHLNPTKSLATLQMNECLSEKGWQLKVAEEIMVG